MNNIRQIAIIAFGLLLSFRGISCGESAGSDFSVCENELPYSLNTPSDTHWVGSDVTSNGVFDPATPGIYTLTLVTDSPSCQESDEIQITVLGSPSVNAGSDQLVCVFDPFQINAIASSPNGNIVVWSWSGDDQYLSSTNIPNPIAMPVGSSSFNLTVADEAGCFSFDQLNLTTADLPEVDAGEDMVICHTSELIELAGSPTSGTWSGPGVSGNDFISPGEGTHNLEYSYTDSDGCTNTDNLSITVNAVPSINAGSDTDYCPNDGHKILVGFSPSSDVTWSGLGVLDAELGEVDPSQMNSGSNTLTMSYGDGTCYVEDQINVNILPLPAIDVLSEYDFCQNEISPELDNFSPSGGHWEGIGVVNATTGEIDASMPIDSYDIFYRVTDGSTSCSDTMYTSMSINEVPEALFDIEALDCIDTEIDITNNSEVSLTTSWFVNAVEVSNDFNPNIQLSSAGTHNINLQVLNEHGCFDEGVLQSIEIIEAPVADFALSANQGCEPFEFSITNNSIGAYSSFDWDFTVSTTQDENPADLNFGDVSMDTNFPIELTVSNICGVSNETSSVDVFALPEAEFHTEITTYCSPLFANFINTSSANSDTYQWDFGDATYSDDHTPGINVYTTGDNSQSYNAILTAENECGISTFSEEITVLPNIVSASFTSSELDVCAPASISFSDQSINASNIAYDFGSFTMFGADVTNEFTEAGTFEILQYVTDGCGFDTSSVTIIVHPEPLVGFTMSEDVICQGQAMAFENAGEPFSAQNWTFGLEGTSSLEDPFFAFNLLGDQTVHLDAVTLENGCDISLTQVLNVQSPPVINYSVSSFSGCSPFNLEIVDNSTNTSEIEWTIGSVSQSNGNTEFELSEPGNYSLDISAINLFGCSSEETNVTFIEVLESPEADFEYSPDELDILHSSEVEFTSTSSGASVYEWDFGDGNTSDEPNPTHTYSDAGTFQVVHTVTNNVGCSRVITYDVTVEDQISVYVPSSFTPNNDGLNEIFVPIVAGSEFTEYQFRVFDRWGKVVFESFTPNEGWNGNNAGGEYYVANGSYTWELRMKLKNGLGSRSYVGSVYIIR